MLGWILLFFIIALIAGVMGFGGVAGAAGGLDETPASALTPPGHNE